VNPAARHPDSEAETLRIDCRGRTFDLVYQYRPGQDEALVYFHGLGGCRSDFHGAWSRVEWSRYTLLAFDAPGCGDTGGYDSGHELTVDDIVDAGAALVQHLDLHDLTVVGHSMGGLAGLLFTLRYPDRVRRFASVEGNLGPEDCSIYSRRVLDERYAGREDAFMDELLTQMRASSDAGFRAAAEVMRDNVPTGAFFDFCRSIVAYSDHEPLRDQFTALEIPRLYIHGEANTHLSHIAHFADRSVHTGCVPGSDHFPAWSNPDVLYDLLVEFIERSGTRR